MTFLVFDSETSGLPDNARPVDDPAQPSIVQLAAQLCAEDGAPIAGFSLIVNAGVPIPERVAAVHGITAERAALLGVTPEFALQAFQHLYARAGLIVAHNLKFDRALIETLIARVHGKIMPLRKPLFCTMEAATPIVNLPPTERMIAAGFNKPKPPKLEECIRHFFGEELKGAHDAMVDLAACRRVYLHLRSLERAAA